MTQTASQERSGKRRGQDKETGGQGDKETIAVDLSPSPILPVSPSVLIDFPLGEPPAVGHARRFVSLSVNFDREQAQAFQKLYYGLHNRSTRLASGRHVENAADVLRWMLEQVAEGK